MAHMTAIYHRLVTLRIAKTSCVAQHMQTQGVLSNGQLCMILDDGHASGELGGRTFDGVLVCQEWHIVE